MSSRPGAEFGPLGHLGLGRAGLGEKNLKTFWLALGLALGRPLKNLAPPFAPGSHSGQSFGQIDRIQASRSTNVRDRLRQRQPESRRRSSNITF